MAKQTPKIAKALGRQSKKVYRAVAISGSRVAVGTMDGVKRRCFALANSFYGGAQAVFARVQLMEDQNQEGQIHEAVNHPQAEPRAQEPVRHPKAEMREDFRV